MTIPGAIRWPVVAAAAATIAPLTWWVALAFPFDELSAESLRYADYAVQPPKLSGSETLAIGLTSLATVLSGVALVLGGIRSGRIRRDWLGVLLPMALLAGYAGLAYRIGTAPVTGANIGFGLMILGGFGIVPIVVAIAMRNAWRIATDGLE